MPPRHNYWTILFGDKPTAFRAATREELQPTFGQIQAKHPDAVMMWFARGRLWRTEEEAREAFDRARSERRRPEGPSLERPRTEHGERPAFRPKPEWRDRDRPRTEDRGQKDSRGPKPEWRDRPQGDRPRGPKPEWQNRGPKPEWRHRDRPTTEDRGQKDSRGPKPEGPDRPQGDRPRGREWRPGGEHKDPRDRFKVPRDVKRARFKDQLRRDRTNPRPPRKKKDEE